LLRIFYLMSLCFNILYGTYITFLDWSSCDLMQGTCCVKLTEESENRRETQKHIKFTSSSSMDLNRHLEKCTDKINKHLVHGVSFALG